MANRFPTTSRLSIYPLVGCLRFPLPLFVLSTKNRLSVFVVKQACWKCVRVCLGLCVLKVLYARVCMCACV